jgi:hypothetical protein
MADVAKRQDLPQALMRVAEPIDEVVRRLPKVADAKWPR